MRTYWYCEQCHTVAMFEHSFPSTSAAFQLYIQEDHYYHNMQCPNQFKDIHILNIAWTLRDAHIPEWAVEQLVKLIEGRQ